jgi:phytoene synthase
MQPSSPSAADLAACRALLRGGSRSFFAASLVLPRRVHEPATALYAFCRLADDAIDCGGDGAAALGPLRARLARAYAGRPLPYPADRALAAVVHRHAIPRALPEALLDGFEWDARGRRYEDIGDLCDYAARVAGTVGAMMAVLMGARACDLGVAMQLTNIARDVGEDARAGRLYLPLRWLREAGIDPQAWLANPVFTPALGGVVRRLLAVADDLYCRADAGIAQLPLSCRPGIGAARRLYAEIGRAVERRGYDSVNHRARVAGRRKLALLARSFAAAAASPAGEAGAPSLDAARFLIDAVAAAPAPHPSPPRAAPWQGLDERMEWLFALFVRLEQRQETGT